MAAHPRMTQEDHLLPPPDELHEESIGNLVRELARDTGQLVRQEIELAKLELKQSVRTAMVDSMKLGVAFGLAIVGGLCLIIALILGLGRALGGAYWAGALITGAFLLVVGGLLTGSAVEGFRTGLKPERTVETLREDGRFAKREAKQLKDRIGG